MRITRSQMFFEMAQIVAKRSTCMRLNVGAVIVRDRRVVSIGYNGVAPGETHCAGNDCPGKVGCRLTTHAEINALNYLPSVMQGPMDLYVTDSPCQTCFEVILDDGRIKRIFFGTPYRITDHLNDERILVDVYRITPAGFIMDWRTRNLVEVDT